MFPTPPSKYLFLLLTAIAIIYSGCKKNQSLPDFSFESINNKLTINARSLSLDTPRVFIYFNSNCDHCQKQISEILKNYNDINKIYLYLISTESIAALDTFSNKYSIFRYRNIMVVRDFSYFFPIHYRITTTPSLVLFSKKNYSGIVLTGNHSVVNILNYARTI